MSKIPKIPSGALKTAQFVRRIPPTADKENPARTAAGIMILENENGEGIDIDVVAKWLGVSPLPDAGEFQMVVAAKSGRWYDALPLLVACIYRLAAYEAYNQRYGGPGTVA